ncbi:hypothetical protein ACMD2_09853, partial [Ananas comosus]
MDLYIQLPPIKGDIVGGIMSPSPPTALLVLLLLVFVAVVCKETTHASALNAATTMGVSPQRVERIQRFLEKINKPAVKSIKSPDGDIIDCVLMNKQLALDHPLLKNHKIQKVAPKRPASRSEAGNQQPRNGTTRRAWQAWNHVGNCPEGTVSVRRTTVEDVLRAGSLSRFGKKKVHKQPSETMASSAFPRSGLSQDRTPTRISTPLKLDGRICANKQRSSPRRNDRPSIDDPNSGNWWLSYQNIDVGYWPNEIFTHLASYATSVQWGGEIVNNDVNGQHTTTQMGSGHFAEEGYRKASYFRNVEVVNSADALIPPQSAGTNAGNPNCYDIQTFSNANWGFYFFYDIVGGIMSPSPPPSALLVLLLLVFVAVVCKETTHASALNAATTMGVSPQKLERIQRYLEKINKPAVKSIKGPDGDIIDCVLMDKQLALDHPLLKNHKIQRPASLSDDAGDQQPRNIGTTRRALQAWNILDNCPDGTVPVQRTTVEDVLRAGSLSRFGKKEVHQQLDQEAYGTKAIIDVWNPTLQQKNEFSLSQIWVAAGSYAKSNINTIEVGWQDPNSGNWWLSYENIDVGYWPAAIFTELASNATSVQWGGEIVNQEANGQHTTTDMGSGHFPKEGYGNASYFRNIEIVNSTNGLIPPQSVRAFATNPYCYEIQTSVNTSWGSTMLVIRPGGIRDSSPKILLQIQPSFPKHSLTG